jgi:hypothetical protein
VEADAGAVVALTAGSAAGDASGEDSSQLRHAMTSTTSTTATNRPPNIE